MRLWLALLFAFPAPTTLADDHVDISTCETCHRAGPGPRLDGQKLGYMRKQLQALRSGTRIDPVMSPIARTLSAPQIDQAAEHYSRLPAVQLQLDKTALDPASRPLVYCVRCHGERGISPNDLWPNLAGLDREYLRRQVAAFASDERHDDMMKSWGQQVDGAALERILAYFAGEDLTAR